MVTLYTLSSILTSSQRRDSPLVASSRSSSSSPSSPSSTWSSSSESSSSSSSSELASLAHATLLFPPKSTETTQGRKFYKTLMLSLKRYMKFEILKDNFKFLYNKRETPSAEITNSNEKDKKKNCFAMGCRTSTSSTSISMSTKIISTVSSMTFSYNGTRYYTSRNEPETFSKL